MGFENMIVNRNLRYFVLHVLIVMIAGFSVSAQSENEKDNPYEKGIPIIRFRNPDKMFDILPGRWSFDENTCANPYVITVSNDKKKINITITDMEETPKETVYVYDVLEVSDIRIKTRIVNEERKTESGKTIEWYYYFSSHDRFMWQATDWKPNAFTAPVERCKESELERNVG